MMSGQVEVELTPEEADWLIGQGANWLQGLRDGNGAVKFVTSPDTSPFAQIRDLACDAVDHPFAEIGRFRSDLGTAREIYDRMMRLQREALFESVKW